MIELAKLLSLLFFAFLLFVAYLAVTEKSSKEYWEKKVREYERKQKKNI